MDQDTPRAELLRGCRDELPILLGVFPFGFIFGALAVRLGIPAVATQASSTVIFGGSSQFVASQLIGAGASGLVVVLVVLVINLRHMLYSASIAPYLQHLKPAWKFLIAYLLTDEAYAVAILNYERKGDYPNGKWYALGAGLTLWSGWQASTAIGILAGQNFGANWPLSFALPLTFIALIIPTLKSRAMGAAAVVSGIVSLLAYPLPYKTGLLIAVLAGILTGLVVERWHS